MTKVSDTSKDKAKNLLNQLSTIHVTQACLVSGRMSFLWICPVYKTAHVLSPATCPKTLLDVSLPVPRLLLVFSLASPLKTECLRHSLFSPFSSRNFNSHLFGSHSFFSAILLFHLPYRCEGQSILTLEFSHVMRMLTWTKSCNSGQWSCSQYFVFRCYTIISRLTKCW